MKKVLTPVLAVIAVAAIVFCFVLNGQKGDLQKSVDDVKAQLENAKQSVDSVTAELETLKTESEAKIAEAEAAKATLEEQLATVKTEAEAKAAEAEAKVAELTKQLEEAAAAGAAAVEEIAEKVEEAVAEAPAEKAAMTHAEYAAAELDSEVYVETYVQATQSWWNDKITVYCQSEDGAYFIYELACSEEDAAKLVPGQKIAVKGYKSEWAGEVEITDGTFELLEAEPWIAEAADVTDLLASEELINHMNELVLVSDVTVEAYDESGAAFAYKNAEEKTDDLYFKVSKDGQVYDFCVEFYLCGQDTDVYKAVEGLKVGDVIDVTGFLYWYNGANLQATGITVK